MALMSELMRMRQMTRTLWNIGTDDLSEVTRDSRVMESCDSGESLGEYTSGRPGIVRSVVDRQIGLMTEADGALRGSTIMGPSERTSFASDPFALCARLAVLILDSEEKV